MTCSPRDPHVSQGQTPGVRLPGVETASRSLRHGKTSRGLVCQCADTNRLPGRAFLHNA